MNARSITTFIILLCTLFSGFVLFAQSARATTLEVIPSSSVRAIGDTFSVSVFVATSGKSVNAVSGALIFPQDKLQFVSATKDGSIISIWPQEPAYRDLGDTGSVQFEGVVLGGFSQSRGKVITATFRTKTLGVVPLKLSEASVLANDGLGTNILTTLIPGSVTITERTVTPEKLSISSTTHPDQTAWYSQNRAVLSWKLPKGTKAVAWIIDQNPTTVPKDTQSATSSYTSDPLSDGVWYAHVRIQDDKGVFGPTAHFKIQIDTSPPENLIVQEIERQKDDLSVIGRFVFDAKDSLSGVRKYEIYVDNRLVATLDGKKENIYDIADLSPGTHILAVQAYDAAGNIARTEKLLDVAGFEAPLITYYAKRLAPDAYFVLRGKTIPRATVSFYNAPYTRAFLWSEPISFSKITGAQGTLLGVTTSDADGDFYFVSKFPLQTGAHAIRAIAKNQSGIQSVASDPMHVRTSVFYSPSVIISILILCIALLLTLGVYIILRKHRGQRALADTVAVHEINGVFRSLDDDLRKKVAVIDEKIKNDEKMTTEEKELLALLSREFMNRGK
jgi:hypothetical protein